MHIPSHAPNSYPSQSSASQLAPLSCAQPHTQGSTMTRDQNEPQDAEHTRNSSTEPWRSEHNLMTDGGYPSGTVQRTLENATETTEPTETSSSDSTSESTDTTASSTSLTSSRLKAANNEDQSEARIEDRQNCPECTGRIIDSTKRGERHCQDCGLIVDEDQIDYGPEWRAYDSQEQSKKSRVGGPTSKSIHDKGLSTSIGWKDQDAYGRTLSPRKQRQMNRLRKWNERCRAKDPQERNLMQALGEIQRLSSELDLPENVEETASVIYRRALDEELITGRSIEGMASAAVFAATRQAGIPRTIDTVVDYSRVEKKRVTRAFSYMSRELGLEIKPPEVMEYLPKVASQLDITTETRKEAEALLETAIENNLHSGKAPAGMAAAAVYAASLTLNRDEVTQSNASEAAGVCDLTIRTRYRELLECNGFDYDNVKHPRAADTNSDQSAQNTDDDSLSAEPASAD